VEQLVKVRTWEEFNYLKNIYEAEFSVVTAAENLRFLTKTLDKAVFGFIGDWIVILSRTKLASVSIIHRVDARMPSTTNSLESTNDHLNEERIRTNHF
jgi:hypothetical protein